MKDADVQSIKKRHRNTKENVTLWGYKIMMCMEYLLLIWSLHIKHLRKRTKFGKSSYNSQRDKDRSEVSMLYPGTVQREGPRLYSMKSS